MKFNCKICENYSSNKLQHGFTQHLISKHHITILEYAILFEGFSIPKCKCGNERKRKYGLVFNKTCGSNKCYSEHLSTVQKQKSQEDGMKEKYRTAALKRIKTNPHLTAWRLHAKNQSWPEKFFEELCIKHGLNQKFDIIREFSVFPYFIDFAFKNASVAVEIDGSQHEREEYKQRDFLKDETLIKNGWRVFRIPAKTLYDEDTANKVIEKLLQFIADDFKKQKQFTVEIKTHKQIQEELSNKAKEQQKQKLKEICLKIEKSNINFSKLGWVNNVSEILQISPQKVGKWMKRNMPDFYKKCYKRKAPIV